MADQTARFARRVKRRVQRVGASLGLTAYPGPAWPDGWRPSLADRLARRPAPAIQALTRKEFTSLSRRYAWYKGRAAYMSAASLVAADLIARHGLVSALELGPHLRPIVTGADAMELNERATPEGARRLIVQDATNTPWPFEDGAYGLFVGLQVFEHLGTAQPMAFAEVARVAKHAIISLPIDWVCEDPTNCHHQISNERALSWFAPRIPTRIIEGNPGPSSRLVYVFEGLDRDPAEWPSTVPPIERPAPRR